MLNTKQEGKRLIIYLSGEIDHYCAEKLRVQIEEIIKALSPVQLHFDFSSVSFMDSSGVGMLIGRYKTMLERGGNVSAGGFKPHVEKLFRMAGLHRIIQIEDVQEEV